MALSYYVPSELTKDKEKHIGIRDFNESTFSEQVLSPFVARLLEDDETYKHCKGRPFMIRIDRWIGPTKLSGVPFKEETVADGDSDSIEMDNEIAESWINNIRSRASMYDIAQFTDSNLSKAQILADRYALALASKYSRVEGRFGVPYGVLIYKKSNLRQDHLEYIHENAVCTSLPQCIIEYNFYENNGFEMRCALLEKSVGKDEKTNVHLNTCGFLDPNSVKKLEYRVFAWQGVAKKQDSTNLKSNEKFQLSVENILRALGFEGELKTSTTFELYRGNFTSSSDVDALFDALAVLAHCDTLASFVGKSFDPEKVQKKLDDQSRFVKLRNYYHALCAIQSGIDGNLYVQLPSGAEEQRVGLLAALLGNEYRKAFDLAMHDVYLGANKVWKWTDSERYFYRASRADDIFKEKQLPYSGADKKSPFKTLVYQSALCDAFTDDMELRHKVPIHSFYFPVKGAEPSVSFEPDLEESRFLFFGCDQLLRSAFYFHAISKMSPFHSEISKLFDSSNTQRVMSTAEISLKLAQMFYLFQTWKRSTFYGKSDLLDFVRETKQIDADKLMRITPVNSSVELEWPFLPHQRLALMARMFNGSWDLFFAIDNNGEQLEIVRVLVDEKEVDINLRDRLTNLAKKPLDDDVLYSAYYLIARATKTTFGNLTNLDDVNAPVDEIYTNLSLQPSEVPDDAKAYYQNRTPVKTSKRQAISSSSSSSQEGAGQDKATKRNSATPSSPVAPKAPTVAVAPSLPVVSTPSASAKSADGQTDDIHLVLFNISKDDNMAREWKKKASTIFELFSNGAKPKVYFRDDNMADIQKTPTKGILVGATFVNIGERGEVDPDELQTFRSEYGKWKNRLVLALVHDKRQTKKNFLVDILAASGFTEEEVLYLPYIENPPGTVKIDKDQKQEANLLLQRIQEVYPGYTPAPVNDDKTTPKAEKGKEPEKVKKEETTKAAIVQEAKQAKMQDVVASPSYVFIKGQNWYGRNQIDKFLDTNSISQTRYQYEIFKDVDFNKIGEDARIIEFLTWDPEKYGTISDFLDEFLRPILQRYSENSVTNPWLIAIVVQAKKSEGGKLSILEDGVKNLEFESRVVVLKHNDQNGNLEKINNFFGKLPASKARDPKTTKQEGSPQKPIKADLLHSSENEKRPQQSTLKPYVIVKGNHWNESTEIAKILPFTPVEMVEINQVFGKDPIEFDATTRFVEFLTWDADKSPNLDEFFDVFTTKISPRYSKTKNPWVLALLLLNKSQEKRSLKTLQTYVNGKTELKDRAVILEHGNPETNLEQIERFFEKDRTTKTEKPGKKKT